MWLGNDVSLRHAFHLGLCLRRRDGCSTGGRIQASRGCIVSAEFGLDLLGSGVPDSDQSAQDAPAQVGVHFESANRRAAIGKPEVQLGARGRERTRSNRGRKPTGDRCPARLRASARRAGRTSGGVKPRVCPVTRKGATALSAWRRTCWTMPTSVSSAIPLASASRERPGAHLAVAGHVPDRPTAKCPRQPLELLTRPVLADRAQAVLVQADLGECQVVIVEQQQVRAAPSPTGAGTGVRSPFTSIST